jgi:hypothetical protein
LLPPVHNVIQRLRVGLRLHIRSMTPSSFRSIRVDIKGNGMHARIVILTLQIMRYLIVLSAIAMFIAGKTTPMLSVIVVIPVELQTKAN